MDALIYAARVVSWSLLGLTVACSLLVTRRQGASPLAAGLWVWVAVLGLRMVMPIELAGMSSTTALIIGLGVVALAAPVALVPRATVKTSPVSVMDQGHPRVAFANYLFASAFVLVLVVIGTITFRSSIQAATGHSFGDLTAEQVRAAQNGNARSSSPLLAFYSLAPLLACLGIYGYRRFSRIWLGLTVLATLAVFESPARTAVLTLVTQIVAFVAYTRPTGERHSTWNRARVTAIVFVGLVSATLIFNSIGEKLNKNSTLARTFPEFPWPSWALSPLVYFTGGVSALSVTTGINQDPFDQGSSIFIVKRIGAMFSPSVHPPNTIGQFVDIPIPFNVYTGFGQVYFDYGYFGVVGLLGLLGWLAADSHRRALAGHLEWAWISTVMLGLLLGLPLGYRLFNVDVAVQIVAGFVIFRAISGARKRASPGGRMPESVRLFR